LIKKTWLEAGILTRAALEVKKKKSQSARFFFGYQVLTTAWRLDATSWGADFA
jgi:hypothetical protein